MTPVFQKTGLVDNGQMINDKEHFLASTQKFLPILTQYPRAI